MLPYHAGAQPELFLGWGGFAEPGHFDKHFVKSTKKQAKIVEFFVLNTVKTTFQMKKINPKMDTISVFFPKLEHLFRFSKKGRVGLPSPPSCAPATLG